MLWEPLALAKGGNCASQAGWEPRSQITSFRPIPGSPGCPTLCHLSWGGPGGLSQKRAAGIYCSHCHTSPPQAQQISAFQCLMSFALRKIAVGILDQTGYSSSARPLPSSVQILESWGSPALSWVSPRPQPLPQTPLPSHTELAD